MTKTKQTLVIVQEEGGKNRSMETGKAASDLIFIWNYGYSRYADSVLLFSNKTSKDGYFLKKKQNQIHQNNSEMKTVMSPTKNYMKNIVNHF